MRTIWFRFWHWFYGKRLCNVCYPPPGRVRACQRFTPAHPVIEVSAKTGKQRSYVAPDSGCEHRHHDFEVWLA